MWQRAVRVWSSGYSAPVLGAPADPPQVWLRLRCSGANKAQVPRMKLWEKQKWERFSPWIRKLKQSVWFHFLLHVISGNISTVMLVRNSGSVAGVHSNPFVLHRNRFVIDTDRTMCAKTLLFCQVTVLTTSVSCKSHCGHLHRTLVLLLDHFRAWCRGTGKWLLRAGPGLLFGVRTAGGISSRMGYYHAQCPFEISETSWLGMFISRHLCQVFNQPMCVCHLRCVKQRTQGLHSLLN